MAKRVNEYKRMSQTSRDGDKLIKQYNDLKADFETVNQQLNVKQRQYTSNQGIYVFVSFFRPTTLTTLTTRPHYHCDRQMYTNK